MRHNSTSHSIILPDEAGETSPRSSKHELRQTEIKHAVHLKAGQGIQGDSNKLKAEVLQMKNELINRSSSSKTWYCNVKLALLIKMPVQGIMTFFLAVHLSVQLSVREKMYRFAQKSADPPKLK